MNSFPTVRSCVDAAVIVNVSHSSPLDIWWNPATFQKLVDHFQGRIHVIKAGEAGYWHPPLNGVTNPPNGSGPGGSGRFGTNDSPASMPAMNAPAIGPRKPLTGDPAYSSRPIRYATRELELKATDVQSNGYGVTWGHTRNFVNRLTQNQGIDQGYNWQVAEWPYLVVDYPGNVTLMGESGGALWFNKQGPNYTPQFGVKATLSLNTVTSQYVLTTQDGTVTLFDRSTGMFRQQVSPNGNTITVTSMSGNGHNGETRHSFFQGGLTTCAVDLLDRQ